MATLTVDGSRESGSFVGDAFRAVREWVKTRRIRRKVLRAERGPSALVRGLAWLVHLFWVLAGFGALTTGMFLTVSPLAGWISLAVSFLAVDIRIDLTHRRRRSR